MVSSGEGRRSDWRARAADLLRDPVVWVDVSQTAKTVAAGVVAWFVATDVFGLDQPFLAPWSAVFVVHATVYRTVSSGAQQVVATILGVLIAWFTGHLFGLGALGMAVALAACFTLARVRWLREEGTALATTGIISLATNAISNSNVLADRLLATAVGIGIGLVVNLLVWPPLRDGAAWSRISRLPGRLADILARMAGELGPDLRQEHIDDWDQALREYNTQVDEAWNLFRQAEESARLNPRRRAREAAIRELETVLSWMEQGVADAQSMTRTIAMSIESGRRWDDGFRSRWAELLDRTATAVLDGDEEALAAVQTDLQRLADDLSTDTLLRSAWHEYGGLLVNLRNVAAGLSYALEWRHRLERTGTGRSATVPELVVGNGDRT
jgi:uncharacterized membrane protein YgaE (UPF0421/DUF939 family)